MKFASTCTLQNLRTPANTPPNTPLQQLPNATIRTATEAPKTHGSAKGDAPNMNGSAQGGAPSMNGSAQGGAPGLFHY